jgi:hypothetical protein
MFAFQVSCLFKRAFMVKTIICFLRAARPATEDGSYHVSNRHHPPIFQEGLDCSFWQRLAAQRLCLSS